MAQELGRLNACSSKPLLFTPQSCLIWWLQPLGSTAEFFCAGSAWQPLKGEEMDIFLMITDYPLGPETSYGSGFEQISVF